MITKQINGFAMVRCWPTLSLVVAVGALSACDDGDDPYDLCQSDDDCRDNEFCDTENYCESPCDDDEVCTEVCWGVCLEKNDEPADCQSDEDCLESQHCAFYEVVPLGAARAMCNPEVDDCGQNEIYGVCEDDVDPPASCESHADCAVGEYCEPNNYGYFDLVCRDDNDDGECDPSPPADPVCLPIPEGSCFTAAECDDVSSCIWYPGAVLGYCEHPYEGCWSDDDCAPGQACVWGATDDERVDCQEPSECDFFSQGTCVYVDTGCFSDDDCGENQVCLFPPDHTGEGPSEDRAMPCFDTNNDGQCDPWQNEGVCVDVGPVGCVSDSECGPGHFCSQADGFDCLMYCEVDDENCGCAPPVSEGFCELSPIAFCDSNDQCGFGSVCEPIPYLNGLVCFDVDGDGECEIPGGHGVCEQSPACHSDDDCGEGFTCQISYGYAEDTGKLVCLDENNDGECDEYNDPVPLPGVCVPVTVLCSTNDDCGEGFECSFFENATCTDEGDEIGCDYVVPVQPPFEGVCVPVVPSCNSDDDCGEGYECEFSVYAEGEAKLVCLDEDNDGQCDGADPVPPPVEGVCVPVAQNECDTDDDCGSGFRCEEVQFCLLWCEVGDESCCGPPERQCVEDPNVASCWSDDDCGEAQHCEFDDLCEGQNCLPVILAGVCVDDGPIEGCETDDECGENGTCVHVVACSDEGQGAMEPGEYCVETSYCVEGQ